MRCVAYARCSTQLQDHSIEIQHQEALDKAQELGYVIDQFFEDEAVSARKVPMAERPQLQALLKDIKAGVVTHLYVYKRDRLARKSLEYMQIYNILKEHDIQVIFTADNEQLMRYDNIGDFMELIFSGLVEREGDLIFRRIRDGIISTFLSGKSPQRLPYGYSIVKEEDTDSEVTGKTRSRVVRNEDELKIVKSLFNIVTSRKFGTVPELEKHLERMGWRRGRNLEPWSAQKIQDAIHNTTYKGVLSKKVAEQEEPLMVPWEELRIVDDAQWQQANDIINEMSALTAKGPRQKVTYALEGLARCKTCGKPLTTKKYPIRGISTHVYRCDDHTKVVVPKMELEDEVFRLCKQELRSGWV